MNEIFDWCVWVLVVLAEWLGITYEEINVWIFVIIWPLLTIALIVLTFVQQRKIRRFEQQRNRE
jgi:Flp pilus assembly protein TadB